MSQFDPVKALKEEIMGVGEIITTLTHRKRDLEKRHGELEVELNQIIKLHGFATAELQRKREVLRALEEQ